MEDAFLKSQEDEPNVEKIEATFCKKYQVVQWNRGKHDNILNFHANALSPKYLPLFKLVCCQLMS